MPTIEYDDITINVDDEGYLLNAEEWDEKVACGLTQTVEDVDECDLTDERIEILKFMRDYYNRFESFPIVISLAMKMSLLIRAVRSIFSSMADILFTCAG